MATTNVIRVGSVEIVSLSDGTLEFDLCNFFPTIPEDHWRQYASHLTDEHKVRFNLGSYLIRSGGRTILLDTRLGPPPAHAPHLPWGPAPPHFSAQRGGPGGGDIGAVTHLHPRPGGLEPL